MTHKQQPITELLRAISLRGWVYLGYSLAVMLACGWLLVRCS